MGSGKGSDDKIVPYDEKSDSYELSHHNNDDLDGDTQSAKYADLFRVVLSIFVIDERLLA